MCCGSASMRQSYWNRHDLPVGLANYATIFADGYFWRATLNTFIVVNVVVYCEIILGLALAALFVRGVPFP